MAYKDKNTHPSAEVVVHVPHVYAVVPKPTATPRDPFNAVTKNAMTESHSLLNVLASRGRI